MSFVTSLKLSSSSRYCWTSIIYQSHHQLRTLTRSSSTLTSPKVPISAGSNPEEVQTGVTKLVQEANWALTPNYALTKTYRLRRYAQVLVIQFA